jgi:phage-related minor tail protein
MPLSNEDGALNDDFPAAEQQQEHQDAIQRRINQLVKQRSEAQAAASQHSEELAAERRRSEELQAQLEAAREQNQTYMKQSSEASTDALKAKLRSLRAKQRALSDASDFDAADAIDDEIINVTAELARVAASYRDAPAQQKREAQSQPPEQKSTRTAEPQPELHKKVQAWRKKNADWFEKDGHEEESQFAYAMFETLQKTQGYTPDDDDLYEELNARIRRAFGKKQEPAQPKTGDEGPPPQSKDKGLTKEDRELMSAYRLDPNNERHVKYWIETKKAAAA